MDEDCEECPFCGWWDGVFARLRRDELGVDRWAVECPRCWARGPVFSKKERTVLQAKRAAAIGWNNRGMQAREYHVSTAGEPGSKRWDFEDLQQLPDLEPAQVDAIRGMKVEEVLTFGSMVIRRTYVPE